MIRGCTTAGLGILYQVAKSLTPVSCVRFVVFLAEGNNAMHDG